jgi:hypothetical protein
MSDIKSPLHDYAEKKVTENIDKNKKVLEQLHKVCLTINALSTHPDMSKRAMVRVIKAVTGRLTGETTDLKSEVERQMVDLFRRMVDGFVLFNLNEETLLKKATQEMKKARNLAEKKVEEKKDE